ncbi:FtsW/RodA/SpoVE family cell cycle protein [Candidatus Gromoviella agglomerans]|uniref:FtsW/RodA/SpoVE family cell cycle protein n=1 Tax=Candidatus Gromoviella agglomerans TaxID=2806609 RepID=UPI001E43CD71|nr:FtsW/RodA/SpoVE family cell cycle protein [Candidatus Gromoviella agglomerans]UFX98438.1 Peptidoglycan glycosyltransferase MrdB [Candidatus Gromoviella agglomerans]
MLIFLFFCLISAFGLVNIYSGSVLDNLMIFTYKQSIFMFFGVCIISYMYIYGTGFFYRSAYVMFFVVAILLVALRFFGSGRGTTRWLRIGSFNLQPSEFAKMVVIFVMARYFHDIKQITRWIQWIPPMLAVFLLFILVVIQPDLGTAVILIALGGSILIFAGLHKNFFIFLIIVTTTSLPILWRFLKPYQKARILNLIFENDPLGAGYQISQSKIAIGSGGLYGKGFLNGTQSILNFLPEKRTDFIFSLVAEEWGFLVCFCLVVSYMCIVISAMFLSMKNVRIFHKLVMMGFANLLFFHIFINIGMVTGIIPVVGVPLPFMSYGGSSYLLFSVGIGSFLSNTERQL